MHYLFTLKEDALLTLITSYQTAVCLKKSDLKNGILSYRRHKTGQQLHIKWESCMEAIVTRYAARCSDGYLLPILKLPSNNLRSQYKSSKDVFNSEYTSEDGTHGWKTNPDKITFPEGKTWKDYVRDTRLEITCGEAPYIASRYDATTGAIIPIGERIGLLDRKLRVVSENTDTSGQWLEAAQEANKSTYAYEWQGDSLLIARESMLYSFIEHYRAKFGKNPLLKSINYIAYIISWNVWQMDGLKGVVPGSCKDKVHTEVSLFGESKEVITPCEGCRTDNIFKHNGTYCFIKDWRVKDPQTGCKGKRIKYIDLLK